MSSRIRILLPALLLCGIVAAIAFQQERLDRARERGAGVAAIVGHPSADSAAADPLTAAAGGQGEDDKSAGNRRKRSRTKALQQKILKKVLQTPAIRNLAKQQIERNIDSIYADYFKKLPAHQAAALRALLIDGQLAGMDQFMQAMDDRLTPEEKRKAEEEGRELWQKNREEMEELLGEEELAKMRAYEESLRDRQQLAGFKEMLNSSGLGLADDQAEALIAMMRDSRTAAIGAEDDAELASLSSMLPEERGLTWQEMEIRWQEVYHQRYLAGAADILSPAQMEVYEQYLAQQLDVAETFADYMPQEMPDYQDRAPVEVGTRGEPLAAPVTMPAYDSEHVTWGDNEHGALLTASNTASGTLAVDATAGSGWGCGITFTPEQGTKNPDGSINVSGADQIVARINAPAGVNLRFGVLESGADWAGADYYVGVNGADGEAFRHEGVTTVDGWQTYTVSLADLKLLGGYGNQAGNRTIDLQAVRSVEILFPGGQSNASFEIDWIRLE